MKLGEAFTLVRFLCAKVIGILCIVTGVVGIFLPIIPGVPLIFLGFALLGGKAFVRASKNFFLNIKKKIKHYW